MNSTMDEIGHALMRVRLTVPTKHTHIHIKIKRLKSRSIECARSRQFYQRQKQHLSLLFNAFWHRRGSEFQLIYIFFHSHLVFYYYPHFTVYIFFSLRNHDFDVAMPKMYFFPLPKCAVWAHVIWWSNSNEKKIVRTNVW